MLQGWVSIPALFLPWQGSTNQLRCENHRLFYLFLSEMSGRKGEEGGGGHPELGMGEGERRGEKGKRKSKITHYLQEGFPHGLPTCHHPGAATNTKKSRSPGSCPESPPSARAARPGPARSISPGSGGFDGPGCSSHTIDFYFLSIKVVLEEMEQGKRMMSRNSRL